MVLGESFKPFSPKPKKSSIVLESNTNLGQKPKPELNNETFIFKYTLSFLAASCAETITYPLDLIKGRLQIQGEKALTNYEGLKGPKVIAHRGMAGTAIGIVKEEGMLRLFQGLSPAIYRHLVYSGVRMTLYEYIREEMLGKNSDNTIPVWKAIVGGMVAGMTAQFLASPADLVKIQIQMEGKRRLQGLEPRVLNARHAFTKILKEGGIRGLWKGWAPNVQRAAFVNVGDLTTYDTAKHLILKHTKLKDDYFTHTLSSVCSGFVAAILGTPADVVKTRVMNQPTDSKGKGLLYKSSVDCLIQAVRGEGFFSLYKGFIPCWISFAVKSKIESFFTGNKIQISFDGKYIFSPCFDVLKVLDVIDGRLFKEIKSEIDDNIITFGLSNDSKTVVIGHQSGLLRQWFWSESRLERTWKSIHSGPIAGIVFDSTDTLVATAGTDSTIKVWHIGHNYCTHNLRGASGVFSCVVFSPTHSEDRYYIYGSADDYSVHVWDLITSEHITKMDGHCSKVTAIEFSLDRQHILTSSRDKLVIVWSASEHQKIRTIPIFESLESIRVIDSKDLKVIDSSVHKKTFLSAGEKGVLKVWNYESGDLLYTQQLVVKQETETKTKMNNQMITEMIYCKEMAEIVVISYENNILFHKLEDFSSVKQFVGHIDEVLDIKTLGPNESHIAVATNSPNIKIFDLLSLNCYILRGHSDIVLSLVTLPSDPLILISSSKDNNIRVWKFSDTLSEAVCHYFGSGHTHSVTSIATANLQNNFIVSGSEDTTLKVWRIPKNPSTDSPTALSAKFTQRAHEKTVNSVAVSPNDQLIATGSQDKTAKIWSIDGLKQLGVMRGHRKGIWSVMFSPVDQVLATSSADATIKIWALIDYSCLKTFEGHDCSVLKVLFIDRGMQLISSSSDGNLKLWNIKSNECIKTIDAHNDKTWALTLSKDEKVLVTGSSDSSIIIWDDVTTEEREETAVKQENQIKCEQNLLNFIQKKKWSKALKLALRLDHPFRTLTIIKEILIESKGYNELNSILIELRNDQLLSLLDYCIVWNTNSKHYIPSQCVMKAVFERISPKDLLKTPELKQKIEKLLAYNERHLNRLNRLQQSITFVDYVWDSIKLPELEVESNVNAVPQSDDVEDLCGSEYVTLSGDSGAESDSDNEIYIES